MDTTGALDKARAPGSPKAKDTSERIATQAQDLTTRVLDFLSNASNETLGACIVGLVAITWLVLGRVGLVLIGIVGGVVLHATWEGNTQNNADDEARALEAKKKREKGLDIALRVLDWKERREESRDINDVGDTPIAAPSQQELDFAGFLPETKDALTNLVDTIIRDYVKWWYTPVLPLENAFPRTCRQTLTVFLLAVSNHLSRKRPADTFLEFLTNSSSIFIVFLSEFSSALKSTAPSSSAPDSVRRYLEANPSSSLANILDIEQQNSKFRRMAQDILGRYLDPKVNACEPVSVFLQEILGSVILDMTVRSCSRPEFINEWIIYGLEESDTEILQAIDAGVGGATANGDAKGSFQAAKDAIPTSQVNTLDSSDDQMQAKAEHKRTVSRAEEAMDEALREAQRLSELIAAEDVKNQQASGESSSSEETTDAVATPTSSRDDLSAIANSSSSALAVDDERATHFESRISGSAPSFTTFDQIISSQQSTALKGSQSYEVAPLSLYHASVSIFDDPLPGEKGILRSKPTAEYLLQIEPATSQHPGWMIARIYSDFETLHEVLRRISVISGVAAFAERHPTVPAWKNKTKAALRSDLELYLRSALSFQRLAESEGMKRFLEKDQGLGRSSPTAKQGGFGFPSPAAFETMGKGMLDVLASAPKGAAGGGKALLGGVSGVLGGVGSLGQKKQNSKSPVPRSVNESTTALPPRDSDRSATPSFVPERTSQESPRPLIYAQSENSKPPSLPRRPSQLVSDHLNDLKASGTHPEDRPSLQLGPKDNIPILPRHDEQDELHLPPPPSEIPDDYNFSQASPRPSVSNDDSSTFRTSTSTAPTTQDSRSRKSTLSSITPGEPSVPTPKQATPNRAAPTPLTGEETSIAVELFFATINELYGLSSAWTLRLTLLNAAKSFLLRPGNPNLEAIRVLLQNTVIDANTSDSGIATHLTKIRENALPTEEELKAWPPPPSEEAKERMRVKARKLLVEKGMPQALTSVMGAAASGEALGRVFDCLQVPEVARGLVFAFVYQGVKAVTQ